MTPGGWDMYGHLWWHAFIFDALPVVVPVAVLIIGWLLYGGLNQWRDARAVTADAEARGGGNPDCARCGGGDIIARCTCPASCPHPDCVGDHTSLATLTAADMRWLREQTIRGHE